MRNYAPQLLKAYELANGLFYPEIVDEERELLRSYEIDKSNTAIILYNRELNKVLRLPYYNRLKPEYVKAVRHKIWGVIYPQVLGYRDFLFVTFKASTKKYHSQAEAHEKIQKEWNSLLTRIRKKMPWVKMIKTAEWQQNGIGYHLHVLFCGIRFLLDDWVRKTWDKLETSGWAIEYSRVFDSPKRAVGYIMKYITKTIRVGDDTPISLVVNWALGLRTFAVSRSFTLLKTNSNKILVGEWVFIGVMPLDLALSSSDVEVLGYFGYG
jgi:hypothetical protein